MASPCFSAKIAACGEPPHRRGDTFKMMTCQFASPSAYRACTNRRRFSSKKSFCNEYPFLTLWTTSVVLLCRNHRPDAGEPTISIGASFFRRLRRYSPSLTSDRKISRNTKTWKYAAQGLRAQDLVREHSPPIASRIQRNVSVMLFVISSLCASTSC
jgi:hypothetical protein